MKTNKIIHAIVLNVLLVGSTYAATLSPYWHSLPEEKNYNKSIEKSAEKDLSSIDGFLDAFVTSNDEVLADPSLAANEKADGWKFSQFSTWLGLGLSGKIGVIAFGGDKTVEIEWAKRSAAKANLEAEESNVADVVINEESSKEDLDAQMEPVIANLVKTKRVTNENELRKNLKEVSDNFYEYSKGMYLFGDYVWYPGKLRLDLNIAASGKVSPFLVKVGADVRFRLEFVRLQTAKKDKANMTEGLMARSTRGLLTNLAQDFTKALDTKEVKEGFSLTEIKVCLAMDVEGKVVVAKVKAGINPCVYFLKQRISNKSDLAINNGDTFDLGTDESTPEMDKYASENKIEVKKEEGFNVYKVDRRRFRRGIDKAFDFGMKFANKVESKKYKRSAWGIKTIKAAYKLSIGGTVGPAKLSVSPEIEMAFKNLGL